jgi:NTP pyrophosphatase (non-canonical NTP hydrolase)
MELPLPSSSAKKSPPQTPTDPARAAAVFEQSVAIMARLRAPGGCPWDREQSFDSIRKYTLEEAYEVFDAIERRDYPHLSEELGDLLLQVLCYAEMAANEGHFTIADVLDHLNPNLYAVIRMYSAKRHRAQQGIAPRWTPRWKAPPRLCCAIGKRSRLRRDQPQ